jgi:hypothetical protein
MWIYEKKLQYPVKVSGKNIQLAKWVITQYGGPDFRFYYRYKDSPPMVGRLI